MCHGVTPHARAGLFSAANLLQGRVDVWCRCVTAGLYLSDDVRRDTVVHLVMQSDDLASCRLVSVDGARVEGLAPAEKNVALLLQRAMQHASLDQLPTLARDAPGGRRSRVGDGDGDEVREKSARNARKREASWLRDRPGSAGPVPGIAVSDHQSLEMCLRDALRGCGAVALLDVDGDDASCVLARPLDNPDNGEGFAVATASVVLKTLVLYAIMITGSIWEREVFGCYLFAPAFFWEDVFSFLVLALHTGYLIALFAGIGDPREQMLLALAAYASYFVNATQFLLKLRAARRDERLASSAAPSVSRSRS